MSKKRKIECPPALAQLLSMVNRFDAGELKDGNGLLGTMSQLLFTLTQPRDDGLPLQPYDAVNVALPVVLRLNRDWEFEVETISATALLYGGVAPTGEDLVPLVEGLGRVRRCVSCWNQKPRRTTYFFAERSDKRKCKPTCDSAERQASYRSRNPETLAKQRARAGEKKVGSALPVHSPIMNLRNRRRPR